MRDMVSRTSTSSQRGLHGFADGGAALGKGLQPKSLGRLHVASEVSLAALMFFTALLTAGVEANATWMLRLSILSYKGLP